MNKVHGRENDSVEVMPTTQKSDVALREEVIQQFWVDKDIFNKSLALPAGSAPKGNFVFYDGPPFATGTPHYGHILAGTIKDAIPRFWTMNGLRVERKWGWDCHGLPLENLIEKKLGLATKRDIEAYGVKNFNEAARGTVMEYADEWKRVMPRMGRWADMEDDYKTMDSTYTESVWWVFSELHKKGLVFEGFKTMHLCPRCGTTLSNFEVNQGYKDIKDIAVTVKLPLLDDAGNVTDTSLLVWTTTPWTLPGNMAAAVHNDIEYVKCRVVIERKEEGADDAVGHEEFVIIAKEILNKNYKITNEAYQFGEHDLFIEGESFKGSELVGKSYLPPFDSLKNYLEGSRARIAKSLTEEGYQDKINNGWKIWHADYVELGTEGTGAVHIAPAYGDEDLKLAQEKKIPIYHHVTKEGKFAFFIDDFAGQLVKPKDDDKAGMTHLDADIEVLKKLQKSRDEHGARFFAKENITHSYPHCWRCDTPLLNYATTSWFVNVPKIKDELVAANNAVKWVPEHVGTNRFGKWLEGARDWAVSRQRYWGAPLPIWKNGATSSYKVFGSLTDMLVYAPRRNNQYYVVRHAQAESNLSGVINSLPSESNPLTETGVAQCAEIAASLKSAGITKIVHSGLQRARQTAELVAASLGLPSDSTVEDVRLAEFQVGTAYEGKTWDEFNKNYATEEEKFTKELPGVEKRRDLIKRVGEFLYEFDAAYENHNVLIVGHGSSIFALECVAEGANMERTIELKKMGYLHNAEVRTIPFTPVPHNDYFELDYHRPYIDDFALFEQGVKLERVPDVFDCWFESGSMPYAQHHFMGKNKEEFETKNFPAQFIAEGLDQTRGWFYSLIVLGTALFGKSPFENVIVTGLALAEDGKKMSKSLKNYPDPMELADRVGVDAMRYYLLTSPIMKAEDLNFSEKEVLELQRKNIGRLHNVLAMYEMYAAGTKADNSSLNVLDRWIISRLNELIAESTQAYRAYELDKATRPLADFIDDVSVWYLRSSRERLKSDDVADKALALGTLRFVLRELAKVMAPSMPFYAEYLFLAVKTESEPESVHLTAWPVGGEVDTELITEMKKVRLVVTFVLEKRTKEKINVRQPITSISGPMISKELQNVVLREVNAKTYLIIETSTPDGVRVYIDTTLTPELLAEGAVREIMRAVQDLRKDAGLQPADRINLTISTNEAGQLAITTHRELLTKTVGASDLHFAEVAGTEVVAGEYRFGLKIERV